MMKAAPSHSKRFDLFIIWGHGMMHAEEIIKMIREDEYIKIVMIQKKKLDDVRSFVNSVYSIDTYPIQHIQNKINYLYNVPAEIIFLLVKNYDVQERMAGKGQFRKVQCRHIVELKESIRDKFNPRDNGKRTEDHVIHATDYEEQVDHFIRLMGYDGLRYFQRNETLPFPVPYHINFPGKYKLRNISLKELKASINTEDGKESQSIEKTPHYISLATGSDDYTEYYDRYKYTLLKEDHPQEKLKSLASITEADANSIPPILVREQDEGFLVLDGVHRVAAAMVNDLDEIRCIQI